MKEIYEKEILRLSQHVGLEESYKIFIDSKTPGLPKLTEMIVYELFINQFDYRSCHSDLYYSYRNVLEYAKELREKGFVDFK
jgi:hypothetical protein